MATILLYNPKEKVRFKVPYLPFSLLTIGTALKRAGYDVCIVDARIEEKAREKVKSVIEQDPLFFGMTLMTGSMIDDALAMAFFVKRFKPSLKVLAGGVHASLLAKETVHNEFIDIVVVGPGEKTCVDIAKSIQQKSPLDNITAIAYKNKGKIIMSQEVRDIDDEHFSGIDYSMVDISRYIKREASGQRCLDYLSSRGCPHVCTFCAIAKVWGRKMIMYPAKEMVDAIEGFIRKYSIDSIHFADDNFFVDKRRVEEFCDEVIKRNIKVNFWATCRISYFANYEEGFLEKLKQAGFHTMNFGAESGSQFVLDKIKKGIRAHQIIITAQRCHRFGFRGQFSFMMAFPFERDEDFQKTMEMIDQIHAIDSSFDCQLFPYVPFPETDLYYECQRYGFVPPHRLEDWAKFEYGKIAMPWLSNEKKKRIDTLTTIAWFAFTSETAIKLGGFQGMIFRFFGKIARLRWRHRFFCFPLEWKIINYFARR